MLDYEGCMPSFVHITDGKQHESKIAKTISFPKGSVLVVDRGYVDYAWMNVLDSNQCFFVTRSKSNMKYTVTLTFFFLDWRNYMPKIICAPQLLVIIPKI
ncbi:transposase [Sphingobacteriaceae bacterium WQ 2009]|uniref:Transposase n=1 Tax=Rhinopithecimicrobium faecis TaxID=2820698 RepID=A0A8T4H9H3_9SPHI|nr:transposase [Sphingobacteriaceae bacterium WQ 2009]